MSASIKITDGAFKIKNNPDFRYQPEQEWAQRLQTRAHMKYLGDEQLFNVNDPRWAQQTLPTGEVIYGHEFGNNLFVIRLQTADGKFNLSHNKDGAFDRHLMNSPGEKVVYSLTSSNNGVESTHTFSTITAGVASIPIICACLGMSVSLASGVAAADAAEAGEVAVATLCGIEVEVTTLPVVGIVLAILGLIGMWIAWAIEVEIMLNLTYENRSINKTISLVDRYFYNIGQHNPAGPVTLVPLTNNSGFEFYSDVVINVDNNSKFKGVGVSLVFQKKDDSYLAICIRNDIHKDPHYTIAEYAKDKKPSAENIYNNCTSGGLVTTDFKWGSDLLVKNRLDPDAFNQYTFAGIIAFNDTV